MQQMDYMRLVDSSSEEEFDHRSQDIEAIWNVHEKCVNPHHEPSFFNWFVKENSKLMIFKDLTHM